MKKTTQQFIIEARKIHGNKYDYSKVVYTGAMDKVCIICPEHGEFLIRVRLSQQPDGLTRVSRLTYEATSEAAEAYARRAEKADPEERPRRRRRKRGTKPAKPETDNSNDA